MGESFPKENHTISPNASSNDKIPNVKASGSANSHPVCPQACYPREDLTISAGGFSAVSIPTTQTETDPQIDQHEYTYDSRDTGSTILPFTKFSPESWRSERYPINPSNIIIEASSRVGKFKKKIASVIAESIKNFSISGRSRSSQM